MAGVNQSGRCCGLCADLVQGWQLAVFLMSCIHSQLMAALQIFMTQATSCWEASASRRPINTGRVLNVTFPCCLLELNLTADKTLNLSVSYRISGTECMETTWSSWCTWTQTLTTLLLVIKWSLGVCFLLTCVCVCWFLLQKELPCISISCVGTYAIL